MIRRPVNSSNLRSVGYDPDKLILEIEFHESGIYQYHGVPERVYGGLLSAKSIGADAAVGLSLCLTFGHNARQRHGIVRSFA